jgi:PIN domain nuclease of toxin-antitoxin system
LRALLDTHALLCWLSDDAALSNRARKFIANTQNSPIVSAASAWEIGTKVRIGKLPSAVNLAANFEGYLEREGLELLSISPDHAIRAGLLAGLHKDPFDRMLIAQAQAEGIPVITNDRVFDDYGVHRIW